MRTRDDFQPCCHNAIHGNIGKDFTPNTALMPFHLAALTVGLVCETLKGEKPVWAFHLLLVNGFVHK